MTFGPHEGLNRTQQLWLILPVHSSLLLAHIPPTSQALTVSHLHSTFSTLLDAF